MNNTKLWLISLVVIAACAWTLTWMVRRKAIPRILAHANEECVADWHAAMTECRQETGTWPDPADPTSFGAQVFIIKSSDGRRVGNGYMTGREGAYSNGILFDVYHQPMRVSREGEHLVVASSGANKVWGDADDVTSDQVKERYQPTTLAETRAAAEKALLLKGKK